MTDNNFIGKTTGVKTRINYLAPGSLINRRFVAAGVEVNSGTFNPHPVTVRDARPVADSFSLDTNGFVLAEHHSAVTDFFDKEEVDAVYPDEVVSIVMKLTGADHVIPQGWMVRTTKDLSDRKESVKGYQHRGGIQPPAGDAHVDYTPDYAERIAQTLYRETFPDERPYKRFIATSLWRCFSRPPQDWPLALCDGRSVGRGEGVPNTLVVVDEIPDSEGMLGDIPGEQDAPAATIFHHNPGHQWWYFSNMHRDEVILLKFHDSEEGSVMRVPHTAFPETNFPDCRNRESIEFRTIAYFR